MISFSYAIWIIAKYSIKEAQRCIRQFRIALRTCARLIGAAKVGVHLLFDGHKVLSCTSEVLAEAGCSSIPQLHARGVILTELDQSHNLQQLLLNLLHHNTALVIP